MECPEIPGCASQGDTVEEALSMIKDVIKGCLECIPKKERFMSGLNNLKAERVIRAFYEMDGKKKERI